MQTFKVNIGLITTGFLATASQNIRQEIIKPALLRSNQGLRGHLLAESWFYKTMIVKVE